MESDFKNVKAPSATDGRICRFVGGQISGTWSSCDFSGAEFGTHFGHLTMDSVVLDDANLSDVDFGEVCFVNTSLLRANLRGASLLGADTNPGLQLARAEVADCSVDYMFLEMLEEYGGLTTGQLNSMKIRNDAAELKQAYSGFWSRLHVVALFAFVVPYVSFLISESGLARLLGGIPETTCTNDTCQPLLFKFGEFVLTGGTFDGLRYTFFVFCFGFAYNILRGFLLWKTKSIELKAEATGLPAHFSLDQTSLIKVYCKQVDPDPEPTEARWAEPTWGWRRVTWRRWLRLARRGFWLNVILVILHSGFFLWKDVPTHSATAEYEKALMLKISPESRD